MSSIDGEVSWARENVPTLAFRTESEIRHIVTIAKEKTAGLRFGLQAIPAGIGAFFGYRIAKDVFGETTGWQTGAAIMIVSTLLAAVGTLAALHIWRRKIRQLAEEPGLS